MPWNVAEVSGGIFMTPIDVQQTSMNSPPSSMISQKALQFATRTIAPSASAVNDCRPNWSVDDDITTVAIFSKQLAVRTVGDNPKRLDTKLHQLQ